MTVAETGLFTRTEALAGLPAHRSQAVLFLIESRTAHLVAQTRRATEPYVSDATFAERDLAFVEAFALGKAPPLKPTIQDLESNVSTWRELVPDNPRGRAALAHLLGQKYRFAEAAVPGIRAALGLDEAHIRAAYQKLYAQPLASIYAPRLTLVERLRWAWVALARWFENLPPFWIVFAFTMVETIGVAILALPIAVAGIGPIPGIAILVILGLVNVLTLMAQAEAAARDGEIRYGFAFLGRMVESYLGQPGIRILWPALLLWDLIWVLCAYLGLASTLGAIFPVVPPALWAIGPMLIVMYYLPQNSMNGTVMSALVIGCATIFLMLLLVLAALSKVQPSYLAYANVPLVNGQPFNVAVLGLIFGTILGAYANHPSIGLSAKLVLPRDPSARSLIWGAAAAQVTIILLYSAWVLGVNGSVDPQRLASETGTALIPLAEAVGPAVGVLGTLYVILTMSRGPVYPSLRLFNLVRERLPRQVQPVVWLPQRRARLMFQARSGKAKDLINLTYLGLVADPSGPCPRFRVDIQQGDALRRVEVTEGRRWDEKALRAAYPGLDSRIRLAVTVQEATPEGVRAQISTPLSVRYEGEWDAAGLRLVDLLSLPDDVRELLTWLMRRREVTATEVAAHTGQDEQAARELLAELVDEGLVAERRPAGGGLEPAGGDARYRAQLAVHRGRQVPDKLRQALDGEANLERPAAAAAGPRDAAGARTSSELSSPSSLARMGSRTRFWLCASPAVGVFLLAELFIWTGGITFTGLSSFVGVIIASLLAGIFPMLMIFASRRKGDFVPGTVYRVLGHPLLVGCIYLLFIAAIFLHGLVIWQDPFLQISALLTGIMTVASTMIMVRQQAFKGRVVVEVCQDAGRGRTVGRSAACRASFQVNAVGRAAPAAVRLTYSAGERSLVAARGDLPDFDELRRIEFDLAAADARDLKIWAHRVNPDGESESLPAVVEVRCGDAVSTADLRVRGGTTLLPWPGAPCTVTLHLSVVN